MTVVTVVTVEKPNHRRERDRRERRDHSGRRYRGPVAMPRSTMLVDVKLSARAVLAATCLTSALVLSGCASSGDDAPASETNHTSVKASIEAPRVTVTSFGEGERRPVAYQDLDATQTAHFSVSLGVSHTAVPAAQLSPEPPAAVTGAPLTGTAELTTTRLSDDEAGASRSVTMTLTDLARTDPSAVHVKDTVDVSPANGIAATWEATGTGRVTAISYTQPDNSTDEVDALLEGYVSALVGQLVIFPDDPIAPGATWTVEMPVIGESNTAQVTSYTLVSHEGSTVVVNATVSQHPTIGALTLDSGETVDVQSAETSSSSTITIDLEKPYPTAGQSTLTTRTVYGNKSSEYAVVQDTFQKTDFS